MDYDEDKLRWKLNTKVDKTTDDIVDECANKFTNGNISEMVRRMIYDWIAMFWNKTLKEDKVNELPEELAFLMEKRAYAEIQEVAKSLQKTALDLARLPNERLERASAKLAEKYGLPWPITNVNPSDVDPDLSRIKKRLEIIWWDGSHDGKTTSRELQRHIGGYSASDLKHHLDRLAANGDVMLMGGAYDALEIISPMTNRE